VIGVYSNIKNQRNEEMSEEDKAHTSISKIMDSIFSESKVDKVLEKYFVVSESEKKQLKKSLPKPFERLSESVEQKLAAEFVMSENSEIKFLGKTNKGNLVFEHKGEQIKISTKGEVL
jgi:ATP-dependent protease Clp ATPase subunit